MVFVILLCLGGIVGVLAAIPAVCGEKNTADFEKEQVAITPKEELKVVTREEFVKAVEIRREEERSHTLARSQAQIDTVKGAIQNGWYATTVQYDPGIPYIIEELQRLYPFLTFKPEPRFGDHRNIHIRWEEKQ